MGDLDDRKLALITVRLKEADRKYIRRIARIRRTSMSAIVAEMIDEHRARTIAVMQQVAGNRAA